MNNDCSKFGRSLHEGPSGSNKSMVISAGISFFGLIALFAKVANTLRRKQESVVVTHGNLGTEFPDSGSISGIRDIVCDVEDAPDSY